MLIIFGPCSNLNLGNAVPFKANISLFSTLQLFPLLAVQSGAHRGGALRGGAHRGGAHRDFHPSNPTKPIHPTFSFRAFLPLYMRDGKVVCKNCDSAKSENTFDEKTKRQISKKSESQKVSQCYVHL